MKNELVILAILSTALSCRHAQAATTWYVDDSHTSGTRNGQSWGTAFQFLNDAINVAAAGDTVKVGQGVYHPDDIASGQTQGDRTKVFKLKAGTSTVGLVIEGGYIGYNNPLPDTRDSEIFVTILSGDLADNDGSGFANNGENSYTILDGTGVAATARLDGFTITGGNGGQGGYGAGVYVGSITASSPTIQNCRIIANRIPATTDGFGAGMYIGAESQAAIVDTVFEENLAKFGGGLFIDWSATTARPFVTRCSFIGNVALRKGGGLFNANPRNPLVRDGVFLSNDAHAILEDPSFDDDYKGGGGVTNENGTMTLVNCLFVGNRSGRNGGAFNNEPGSTATLINVTFFDNFAVWQGGGIAIRESTTTIKNCIA